MSVVRSYSLSSRLFSQRVRFDLSYLYASIGAIFVACLAAIVAYQSGYFGFSLSITTVTLSFVLLPYFLYGMTSVRRDLRYFLKKSAVRLVVSTILAPTVLYCFYAFGCEVFDWKALTRLLGFLAPPTLLAIWAGSDSSQMVKWQDFFAIASFWLPFDLGFLNSIWTWPAGDAAYIINTGLAVSIAVTIFAVWRDIPDINFRWVISWEECLLALKGVAWFSLIALPIGLMTEFLMLNPVSDLAKITLAPVGVFVFIAIPEELLFRGLLQNFLSKFLASKTTALILTSLIFGASHLNNQPILDWRFFVLATLAGGVYGIVFDRSKSLFAPALTHTLVDVIWALLLHV